MPGYHTPKERRKAAHIARHYRMKGIPERRAKKWAWMTVNSGRRKHRR
jgi:hypothetical protein